MGFVIGIILRLLIIFFICFIVYDLSISSRGGAPFIPMPKRHLRSLIKMTNPNMNDIFFDLGCGDGRSLFMAINEFGVRQAVGYEIAKLPFFLARIRSFFYKHGDRVKIIHDDFRLADFSNANIVYIYLMPKLVSNITPILIRQLKQGTRIISAAFPIDTINFPQFQFIRKEHFGNISGYLYKKI